MADLFNEFFGNDTPTKKTTTKSNVKKQYPISNEKNKPITNRVKSEMRSRTVNRMTHLDKDENVENNKPYEIKKPDRFNFDTESISKELNSPDDLAKFIIMGEILNKPKFRR